MAEEIVKDEVNQEQKKPDSKPAPKVETPKEEPTMSLSAFLNMFTLARHIRFKYERLFRFQVSESHTYKEWSDTTGLGKEEVKK